MRPIEEQTILVTGTTSGLGQELAQALAQQGASLLVHARDADRGPGLVRKIKEATGNHRIQFYRADLSSLAEVGELARQVISDVARLDVLVMPTKMVLEAGWQTMSSVEEGLKATLRLVVDPALENVTGEYFDGLSLAKAKAQAYDKQAQQRLAALSQKLVSL